MKEKEDIEISDNTELITDKEDQFKETIKYQSASIMLDIAKDEYTKERERANSIDNKLGIFISAIFAIIAIYIPIIPFHGLKTIYQANDKCRIILATIFICILITAAINLFIALAYLISAITLKPFNRVNYTNLEDEYNLCCSFDIVEKSLIEHYTDILDKNTMINDKKAKKFTRGLIFVVLFFSLLMIASIGLLIIT